MVKFFLNNWQSFKIKLRNYFPTPSSIVSDLAAVSRITLSHVKQRNIMNDKRTIITLDGGGLGGESQVVSPKGDGWSQWRDWFYTNITKPENKPLSSQIRATLLKIAIDRGRLD